jgi:hypothetical protein
MIVEARFALIVDTKGGRLALEAPRFTDAEACEPARVLRRLGYVSPATSAGCS